jgi:hypothetical protein
MVGGSPAVAGDSIPDSPNSVFSVYPVPGDRQFATPSEMATVRSLGLVLHLPPIPQLAILPTLPKISQILPIEVDFAAVPK